MKVTRARTRWPRGTTRVRHLGAVGLVVTVGWLPAPEPRPRRPAGLGRQRTRRKRARRSRSGEGRTFQRADQVGDHPDGNYVMNADGSRKRLLTRSTSHGLRLVARRAEDRLRQGAQRQRRHPRHERRRERATEPHAHAQRCSTKAPSGRPTAEDRVHEDERIGPRTRDLRHECRRERAAEADAQTTADIYLPGRPTDGRSPSMAAAPSTS